MTDEWESLGRELLQYELERHGQRVETVFRDAATQISRGEDIEHLDLDRLRVRLEQAEAFLHTVEQVSEQ